MRSTAFSNAVPEVVPEPQRLLDRVVEKIQADEGKNGEQTKQILVALDLAREDLIAMRRRLPWHSENPLSFTLRLDIPYATAQCSTNAIFAADIWLPIK